MQTNYYTHPDKVVIVILYRFSQVIQILNGLNYKCDCGQVSGWSSSMTFAPNVRNWGSIPH